MLFKKNQLYHIGRSNKKGITEGGFARDQAFFNFFKDSSKIIKITNNKITNIFKVFSFLLLSNGNKIIMHYPLLGVPVSNKFFLTDIIRKCFLRLIKIASERNSIIFDISDLPIEQARDLELKVNLFYKEIENIIFNLRNTHYIFASYSMRDYICNKFSINKSQTTVCINGGNEVSDLDKNYSFIINNETNYVYAGTLNKGRQIEKMIDIFKSLDNTNLILMGQDGEWIEDYNINENIKYLGALEEDVAHHIVSLCDMGLIPYDSDRFYYNIAYPTKLSFYITAGIPFLSTGVKEIKNINENFNLGYILDINEWEKFIKNTDLEEISYKKENVNKYKENFLWNDILKNIDEIL